MAKYRVQLVERVHYVVEVDADDEDTAMEAAKEAFTHSEDVAHDFNADPQGVTVRWVDRLKVSQ